MDILVTGASGFVGGRLAEALVDEGHVVRAMTRRPDRYRGAGRAVRADVGDPDSLDHALRGADIAYYLVHSLESDDFERRDADAALAFGSGGTYRWCGTHRVPRWVGCRGPDPALAAPALAPHGRGAPRRGRRARDDAPRGDRGGRRRCVVGDHPATGEAAAPDGHAELGAHDDAADRCRRCGAVPRRRGERHRHRAGGPGDRRSRRPHVRGDDVASRSRHERPPASDPDRPAAHAAPVLALDHTRDRCEHHHEPAPRRVDERARLRAAAPTLPTLWWARRWATTRWSPRRWPSAATAPPERIDAASRDRPVLVTETRHRVVAAATLLCGAAVLGWSFNVDPGSGSFYLAAVLLAVIWSGGALLGGALAACTGSGAVAERPGGDGSGRSGRGARGGVRGRRGRRAPDRPAGGRDRRSARLRPPGVRPGRSRRHAREHGRRGDVLPRRALRRAAGAIRPRRHDPPLRARDDGIGQPDAGVRGAVPRRGARPGATTNGTLVGAGHHPRHVVADDAARAACCSSPTDRQRGSASRDVALPDTDAVSSGAFSLGGRRAGPPDGGGDGGRQARARSARRTPRRRGSTTTAAT